MLIELLQSDVVAKFGATAGLADPWITGYTYTSDAAGNATVAFIVARDQIG